MTSQEHDAAAVVRDEDRRAGGNWALALLSDSSSVPVPVQRSRPSTLLTVESWPVTKLVASEKNAARQPS